MEPMVLVQLTISAIFVNNLVLHRFLGLCPFFGVSRKLSSAVGMGMAVMFVMVVATMVTWPLQRFVLAPADAGYLSTIVFILVIAALVQLVELALARFAGGLYESLGIYLPLITTNCAILGVALIATDTNPFTGRPYVFVEAFVNAIASAAGFTLALVLMAGVRERLRFSKPAAALEGLPLAFVAAGLMALAFLGFSGFELR